MNCFWIGDRIHYSERDWEITDISGNLLGLIDLENGERLTASLFRVSEECPLEDRLGRGTAALSLAETLETQVKGAGQRDGVLAAVDRLAPDVQEVAFGRAEGATEFKPGYGHGSSRWSRAGLKESELRALADQLKTREPGLARKLALSQSTLFRKARAYETDGPAALIDRRMTRTHRVTDLVPPEVLEVCEQVNRELIPKSNISKSQRLAMVRSRIAKQYPAHEFKVPGNGRLRKVLDELAKGVYLTGNASNRRSAAAVPERVLKSRPALLPGSEMQEDSTKLDILVIFPDGKVRRPDFAWIIDKATRCVGGTALAVKIRGADLAFMIAQCMTPRPRGDMPDEPKNRWEMHQRDLPWPQFFDPDAREKVDVRAPLIRPCRIVTDRPRRRESRRRLDQEPAETSFWGQLPGEERRCPAQISFSCSSSRIRFLASLSSAASFSVTPGRAPSSLSAFFSQLCGVASEIPKSLAIWEIGASCFRATATTSRRNSTGKGLGMLNILAARTESSQVRSQANKGQSRAYLQAGH